MNERAHWNVINHLSQVCWYIGAEILHRVCVCNAIQVVAVEKWEREKTRSSDLPDCPLTFAFELKDVDVETFFADSRFSPLPT